MSESLSTSSVPADTFASTPDRKPEGLVARYRLDHKNPVNHFLHVGVGWPMVAISILLLPFRPLWSVLVFASAYAIMFLGHFVFERNTPTILKEPSTPFVIAYSVMRDLWAELGRMARRLRVR
jgi:hypothetical protein